MSDVKPSGCRVARLKVLFRLPVAVEWDGIQRAAPPEWPKYPLAYVTWFSRFKSTPDNDTGMYRVEPAKDSKGLAQGATDAIPFPSIICKVNILIKQFTRVILFLWTHHA